MSDSRYRYTSNCKTSEPLPQKQEFGAIPKKAQEGG
jgi:hypothetical protein